MILKHTALVCSTEKNADKFYSNLLGLKKSEPINLPRHLSKAIFSIDSEVIIINYKDNNIHFEIFIHDQPHQNNIRIEHVCLKIDDLDTFIKRCKSCGVKITQVQKNDKVLTFISDYDNNLFEIKTN